MDFLVILRMFPLMFKLVITSVHTVQKNLERISFLHCLVNTRKFVLRWNTSVAKMPSVSFDISMCIAIMKSLHEMHVTICCRKAQKALLEHLTFNYKNDSYLIWSHSMTWPTYGVAWKSTEKRTCAVYR